MLTKPPVPYDNCVADQAVEAAFKQEKALVGAFSVLTNLRMELFQCVTIYVADVCPLTARWAAWGVTT